MSLCEINKLIKTVIKWRGASLVAQLVKNPPAVQKTRVQSLGWEDHLEKEMAIHSSALAWRIRTCHLFRKLTYQSNNKYVSDKAKVLLNFSRGIMMIFFVCVCTNSPVLFFFPFNLKKIFIIIIF